MIRVELPANLRALARVDREVKIELESVATQRSVLDALEACYPMLRGTIRDYVSQQRRPFLRLFACETDLSQEPPDAPLPEAVASGAEPLLIIEAPAGGQEGHTVRLHGLSERDVRHLLTSEVLTTPSEGRKHKASILVIDDEPASLKLLFNILTEDGYAVHERKLDLESQLRFVKATLPDLVLVDVRRPEIDGYRACAGLKSDPATRAIPVIFISSIDRSINQSKTLLSGAVDYVTDPFDAEEVLWRIETHISLRRLRENLESAAYNHGAQPVAPNEDLERAFQEIHVLTQVTGRKHAEEKVRQTARELKRAEAALRSTERNLAAIINTIPTAAWTARPDGYCDFINQVWLDYVGMTAERAQGWGWAEAIHPDDRKKLVDDWQSSLVSGTPVDTEARIRRFDSSYRWFLIRGNPLRGESGDILKWYGTNIDIEDRKRGEEALRAREVSWRLIVDNIPGLVATMGAMGDLEFLNRQTLEYFGKTVEELKNWSLIGAVHPDDLPRVIEARKKSIEEGQMYEIEHRCRRADGVYRWFQVRGLPVRNAEGVITLWYLLLTDIDGRKQAEAQVEQAYVRLAEAQQLSKTGSFITDLLVDDHNWSEEAFRIFEFDPATKVTVQKVRDMVHPEDLPSFDNVIARGMQGIDVDFVFRIVTPRGAVKHIRGMARVIEQIAGRPLFIGALQDVTESKLAEEALSKARSELAHVARVTTLNALTASVAHEVNQPLSGIITNASTCLRMLNSDPPNVDGARETARRAIRDGNRASDVITRLRALFSKKELALEPLDLSEATQEVIALSLTDLQRNRVTLRSEFADDLPRVTGDRVQLQQVILNLLRNASDAMVGVDDRPRELLIKTERDEGDHVRLSVTDAGVGFRPEAADKLFEAFYTTKNDGMGIGLSVSRSIIEAHHGRLWARPNDGPGATFSFAIPCSTDTNVQ